VKADRRHPERPEGGIPVPDFLREYDINGVTGTDIPGLVSGVPAPARRHHGHRHPTEAHFDGDRRVPRRGARCQHAIRETCADARMEALNLTDVPATEAQFTGMKADTRKFGAWGTVCLPLSREVRAHCLTGKPTPKAIY
jgi:hypothetical protein